MNLFNLALAAIMASSVTNIAGAQAIGSITKVEAGTLSKAHKRRLDIDDVVSMSMGSTATTEDDGTLPQSGDKSCHSSKAFHTDWWPKQDDEDNHCAAKGEECNGFSFYFVKKIGGGSARISWRRALRETPDNCILAPISSEQEFENLRQEARGLTDEPTNLWVGIVKSAYNANTDNGGNGSRDNWFNMDGTPAAVCDKGVWVTKNGINQPDNDEGPAKPEKYAHLWFEGGSVPNSAKGKLRDVENDPSDGPMISAAIYKCCKEVITFPSCDAANHWD